MSPAVHIVRPFVLAMIVSGCATALASCGEKEEGRAAPSQEQPNALSNPNATSQSEVKPRYADTISGLGYLMRDIRTAVLANSETDVAELFASLRLLTPSIWFESTFGPSLGKKLAAQYQPVHDEIGLGAKHISEKFKEGLREITVERFASPGMPDATGYQSAALQAMLHPTALYSVRLQNADASKRYHLWSFVYQGGSFRYVSKLRGVTDADRRGGKDLNEYALRESEKILATGTK